MFHEPARTGSDRTLDHAHCGDSPALCGNPALGIAGIRADSVRLCRLFRSTEASHFREPGGRGKNNLQLWNYGICPTDPPSRDQSTGSSYFHRGMGRQGFLALGGAITLLVFLFGAGIGLSMIHIRAIAQRQINLDRCAGSAAHFVRHMLRDLTRSHLRVETSRLATLPLLPTPTGPAALEIFRKILTVEAMIQRAIKLGWEERKTRWNDFPGVGCGLRNRPQRSRFPDFGFSIVSPEASILETQSSSYLSNPPGEVRLSLSVAKLSTEALVEPEKIHEWSVRWSR